MGGPEEEKTFAQSPEPAKGKGRLQELELGFLLSDLTLIAGKDKKIINNS